MLGAIIGDIIGSVYEWDNIKTKDFPLFSEHGFLTDDTVMTIAIADALLKGGEMDDFIDSMKKFGRLYPDSGYGDRFDSWLSSDDREPYNSWGNGSAMRVSPCAWFAESLGEAETFAERSAAVTHNHPEGIKGAQATAAAIYLARTGKSKSEIKEYIQSKYGYDLNRTLDKIRPVYRFNETCKKTVPEAIIAFLESTDFEDAIRNAISIGGDSDTIAAITGSIAEAAFCIPSIITTNAFRCLDDTLSAVINAWLDIGKPIGAATKKTDWKTQGFSKPHTISANFRISEKNYARIRHGLLPEQMEDKWFAYFNSGRIHFHRSWTGAKIYEAVIHKVDSVYTISEIIVERDTEIYSNMDDDKDIRSFNFLMGRGILGLSVEPPMDSVNGTDVLRGWSSFGGMILEGDLCEKKVDILYVYKVDHDLGVNPNPFGAYCTLADCKGVMRDSIQKYVAKQQFKSQDLAVRDMGIWVIGIAGSRLGEERRGKLLYAMQVTEVLEFEKYWADSRFDYKTQVLNERESNAIINSHKNNYAFWRNNKNRLVCGDNINLSDRKDLATGCVLVSDTFIYHGTECSTQDEIIKRFKFGKNDAVRGHRIFSNDTKVAKKPIPDEIISYIQNEFQNTKCLARPTFSAEGFDYICKEGLLINRKKDRYENNPLPKGVRHC